MDPKPYLKEEIYMFNHLTRPIFFYNKEFILLELMNILQAHRSRSIHLLWLASPKATRLREIRTFDLMNFYRTRTHVLFTRANSWVYTHYSYRWLFSIFWWARYSSYHHHQHQQKLVAAVVTILLSSAKQYSGTMFSYDYNRRKNE